VAKYTISGCLAIFQEKSPDAITCAARLQRKIRELRRALRKTNRTDISVGIAIHSGKVAVGTIGSNTRLDTMALSEDVNITYAVGGQTSKTNTQILITEEAMPYCRSYINYVYEGHYFISNGKQILVYSALPIKKSEQAFEETLDPIEDEDEL
jgi:class 3 adenylate cyclase